MTHGLIGDLVLVYDIICPGEAQYAGQLEYDRESPAIDKVTRTLALKNQYHLEIVATETNNLNTARTRHLPLPLRALCTESENQSQLGWRRAPGRVHCRRKRGGVSSLVSPSRRLLLFPNFNLRNLALLSPAVEYNYYILRQQLERRGQTPHSPASFYDSRKPRVALFPAHAPCLNHLTSPEQSISPRPIQQILLQPRRQPSRVRPSPFLPISTMGHE